MTFSFVRFAAIVSLSAGLLSSPVLAQLTPSAQEKQMRSHIAERLPQFPPIEEIRKSPIPGIFELRVNGSDIYYSDAQGDYIFQGSLYDTRQSRNLTEERVQQLTAVKFSALPFKDAFTIVRGNGKRQLAVFEDPNCSYCKRFERDLQKIDNVTVHLFLYPILGPDSLEKSKAIWCAKDRGKTWQDWMVRDVPVPLASCDTAALTRNLALGRSLKITGTPTLIFANGVRVPGAISADQVEKHLVQAGS